MDNRNTATDNETTNTHLNITVVGAGIMGSGIATSLLRSGIKTTVWNRTIEKAEHLAALGARVEPDPRKAIAGADAIFVVLFDGDSVRVFWSRHMMPQDLTPSGFKLPPLVWTPQNALPPSLRKNTSIWWKHS